MYALFLLLFKNPLKNEINEIINKELSEDNFFEDFEKTFNLVAKIKDLTL